MRSIISLWNGRVSAVGSLWSAKDRSILGKAGRLTYCRQAVPACSWGGGSGKRVRRDALLTVGQSSRLAPGGVAAGEGKAGRLTLRFGHFT
jgi:hypothetical protein